MTLDRFQVDHLTTEHYEDNDVDDTYKLPSAHPISAIQIVHELEDSAANVESVIDKLDVEIAGQSLFGGLTGTQILQLCEWWRGRNADEPADGQTETWHIYIPFARFPFDGGFGLPSDRFNARLNYQASRTTADTENKVQVYVEQLMAQSGIGMAVPKVSQPDDVTVDDGDEWQLEGNAGRRLASLYLDLDAENLATGGRIQAHVNNRQETIYNVDLDVHKEWMLQERDIRDDTLPTGFLAFPIDRARQVGQAPRTGRGRRIRDFRIEGTAEAGAAEGSVQLIQEDYVVLEADE